MTDNEQKYRERTDEVPRSSYNIYTKEDVATGGLGTAERVFISHRGLDKAIAAAIASLLEALHVHYWFDQDDEDTQRAAALGMRGDQALIHAIDRGIRHSTRIVGILSINTRLSWWVPYEIGSARAAGIPASFLILSSLHISSLPEFIRLCALYRSLDEMLRWATFLSGGHMQTLVSDIPELPSRRLHSYVPVLPPDPTLPEMAQRAVEAIDQLHNLETQRLLRLTSTNFDWLPTTGGFLRDIAYDIFAPLAYYQLNQATMRQVQRLPLRLLYLSITQHNALAKLDPKLDYEPVTPGWRAHRYRSPGTHWLQGMSVEQLESRLDRFFTVLAFDGRRRLATNEEFKAEFDRILRSRRDSERQALGVLLNPIMGFNLRDRPVFCRILAIQVQLYQQILRPTILTQGPKEESRKGLKRLIRLRSKRIGTSRDKDEDFEDQPLPSPDTLYDSNGLSHASDVFNEPMRSFAQRYLSNASRNGRLSDDSIDRYLQVTRVEGPERVVSQKLLMSAEISDLI